MGSTSSFVQSVVRHIPLNPSGGLHDSKNLEGHLRVRWSLALGNLMASLFSCPLSCHVPLGRLVYVISVCSAVITLLFYLYLYFLGYRPES